MNEHTDFMEDINLSSTILYSFSYTLMNIYKLHTHEYV